MKFTFNTGRQYAPEGQIITVQVIEDGFLFRDHTRCVSGHVLFNEATKYVEDGLMGEWNIKPMVMGSYDTGAYRLDQRADQLEK